jgi:hypothetical protein
MKKLVLGGFFLTIAVATLVGCKKENVDPTTAVSTNEFSNKNLTQLTGNISVENGMLKFVDMDHVRNTLDALETAFREHEDNFLAAHPQKSGEELMVIEETSGFNEYQTYENFESTLNFSSLRAKIQSEYTEYMNMEIQPNEDPEDHYIFEASVQAIVNEFGELKVGNAIYKLYENGHIVITNGDYNTLLAIRDNYNLAYELDNVQIEGDINYFENKSAGCEGHKVRTDKYETGSRRIKWRIAIRTWPWNRYVIAESTNYLKQNGKWKKFRCHTKCRVWGDISDWDTVNGEQVANCDDPLTFNTSSGVYSDKYNTKNWQHKIFVSTKTKTNWVKGYHESYIGATTICNSVLTF